MRRSKIRNTEEMGNKRGRACNGDMVARGMEVTGDKGEEKDKIKGGKGDRRQDKDWASPFRMYNYVE